MVNLGRRVQSTQLAVLNGAPAFSSVDGKASVVAPHQLIGNTPGRCLLMYGYRSTRILKPSPNLPAFFMQCTGPKHIVAAVDFIIEITGDNS